MKKLCLLIFVFILVLLKLNANVIHVNWSGTGDYTKIQEGIDASVNGDTILVEPGTYVENINYNGKNIVVGSLFFTTNDTSYISQTIIDANYSNSVVKFLNQEDTVAVLSGFSIKHGQYYRGAGIYCHDASPNINNIRVSRCYSDEGGGMYFALSNSTLGDIKIVDGSADISAGGIYIQESNLTFNNLSLISNNCQQECGGIYIKSNSNVFINDGYIVDNTSGEDGSGILCVDSYLDLKNTTIIGNKNNSSWYGWGGGIYYHSSQGILNNVLIKDNESNAGGGMYVSGSSIDMINVEIKYNSAGTGGGIVWNNSSLTLSKVSICNNIAENFGAGIYFLDNSEATFDEDNRSNIYDNIYVNNRGSGRDIYAIGSVNFNAFIDTFTVINPSDYYVTPIDSFNFNILHGLKDSLINSDIYVSVDGNNQNSGISPESPFKSISYALSRIYSDSVNHNTIFLSPGVYSPSNTNEVFPIHWNNYVSLEGNSYNETILDAESTNNVLGFWNIGNVNISNITVKNGGNCTYYGGGIFCKNSSPVFRNLMITNNHATRAGGVYIFQSSPLFINTQIVNNRAWISEGGGIYSYDSESEFYNVTVSNNIADEEGGGIHCSNNNSLYFTNSIIWDNPPVEIYFSHYGETNTITISYSDLMGGQNGIITNDNCIVNWLEGNTNDYPCFINPDSMNYHFLSNSPCIDTGTPDTTGLYLPPWDLDGNERVWDGNGDGIAIIDMGCYEYDAPPIAVDDIPGCEIEFSLLQNYPNPFSNSTTISVNLFAKPYHESQIGIYNIKGQLVARLIMKVTDFGENFVTWNGKGKNDKILSNGVYLYRFESQEYNSTFKKMLLIN